MMCFVHFFRRRRLLLLHLKALGRVVWIVEWRRRVRYSTVVIRMSRARNNWIWWELISWRSVKCCKGYSRACCRVIRSNEEFRARKILSRVRIKRLRGYLLLLRGEWGEMWQWRVKCSAIGLIFPKIWGGFFVFSREAKVWLYCVFIGGLFGV